MGFQAAAILYRKMGRGVSAEGGDDEMSDGAIAGPSVFNTLEKDDDPGAGFLRSKGGQNNDAAPAKDITQTGE